MCRHVVEHKAASIDYEPLVVIQIFEEGINKQTIKKLNRYTQKRRVLIGDPGRYEFKR
ncbi:hypothetical protein [Jeotgalibacillus proteolyticus]|uniref:hypothetical protein n=1 Tax=Jeotgalibacillus proteolyticus TaxID=2082395 RepID=UPI0014310152|nr:hypothetical protein [Jeotgalibacillus proteolyticus]